MSDVVGLVNNLLHVDPPIKVDTMKVLSDFLLLWNVYEAKYFRDGYKTTTLKHLIKAETINPKDFSPIISYFVQRYCSNTMTTNSAFERLNFRRNDCRGEVVKGLTNPLTRQEELFAVLTIIYRLRNNLFHGLKEAASFNMQKENFEIANRMLIAVLQR